MSQELDLMMRRRGGSRGGWQPILQRLAFGLLYTQQISRQHGWKLSSCLLSALGKGQSSMHDGTAIRWRARVAKSA